MSKRVVIADDHPPTRAGVRLSLEEAGFEVCGEASNAAAAVEACMEALPDVALLDIHMPGNGIVAAQRIAAALPGTAVVMLTVSRDDADLFEALRAGARGYLLKDIDPARLGAALEGVMAGEAALPRNLVTRLMEEFRGRDARPQGPLSTLTSREWETLDLMRAGLSTGEIADRLFVSPVTVRTHIAAILRKLQVSDRQSAIEIASKS
ncbi:MAG: response regulator transcription factor [Frankiaceae bacterium]|nr:response regulator transcription factor [Frankiaceae bacterium]